MILKKYKIHCLLLLASLMIFSSCDKVLEIEPTIELESNFFITEARVQRGIGAVYAALTKIYGSQLFDATQYPLFLLPADDLTYDGTGSVYETFSGFNASDHIVGGIWDRLYIITGRCNFMLEKIEEPEIAGLYVTEGLKDANHGEMLFIRSWVFFKLWDWFRKAPIQDERIPSIEEAILPPSQGFEMLDKAIADLEEAATLLPNSWDERNLGRITKNSAYGLLVKCYVTRANYNQNNTEDYGKAITAFQNISNDVQLVHFGENFDYRTENNAESLFEFQASQATGVDNSWLDNDFGGGVGQMGSFYHYFNNHWSHYLSGVFGPTQKLVNAFEPGDPRMFETLSDSADNLGGVKWWVEPQWDKFNGYQIVKYINGERETIGAETSWNNYRILRLGDVKLLAAEAYLATGNSQEALKQVNDIRERARNSTVDGIPSVVPADLSSVTMQDIMDERFVELAGEEGHRWTDLRRWHAAGYIDLDTWTATDFGFPYDPNLFAFDASKHVLFPIPVAELERNPEMTASGNNLGY